MRTTAYSREAIERLIELSVGRIDRAFAQAYKQLQAKLLSQELRGLDTVHTRLMIAEIEGILEDARAQTYKILTEAVKSSLQAGDRYAVLSTYARYGVVLPEVNMGMSFAILHKDQIARLVYDTYKDLAAATQLVSRELKRAIRKAANNTLVLGALQGSTRVEITKDMMAALRKAGFSAYYEVRADGSQGRYIPYKEYASTILQDNWVGFIDSRGRRWDLRNYCRMVTRTKLNETASLGTEDRLRREGLDLVQIVGPNDSTDWCSFYVGKVFSLSGTDKTYPPLAQCPNQGTPFHPNCRHHIAPFIARFHEAQELQEVRIDRRYLGLNNKEKVADQKTLTRMVKGVS